MSKNKKPKKTSLISVYSAGFLGCTVVVCLLVGGLVGWFSNEYIESQRLGRTVTTYEHKVGDITKRLSDTETRKAEVEKNLHETQQLLAARARYTPPSVKNGLAPVISRVDTKEPVVFLTIDDGAYKELSVVSELRKHNVKPSLFLSDMFIADKPSFFNQIVAKDKPVQNHTLHHDTKMSTKSLAYQQAEICGMSDKLHQYYGQRPYLFRPPGGSYTATTQQAVAACGMRAIINWSAKANGGSMQYQEGAALRAGDIVLMHFRPEFTKDLDAFVKARDAAGLRSEQLEDWIPPVSTSP